MSVYIYCIREDYVHKSSIKNREFDNAWLKLEKDGTVTVKGANENGYAWDGCSPKIKIKDIYFGIPEAVLNFETGKSKTYHASLIHDIFYQFAKEVKMSITRKEVDRELYNILKKNQFSFSKIYYGAVRLLGWIFW